MKLRQQACSPDFTTPLPVMEPLIPQAEMVERIERIRREDRQEDCPACGGSGKREVRG
jgi:hypothetical protein